jgi:hypothetical protein
LTSFDFIDADEGRPLRFENASFSFAQASMPIGAALTMFDFIDLDEGHPSYWQR